MTDGVKIRNFVLPDGDFITTAPDLETAIATAYGMNMKEEEAAEVQVSPGVWYTPGICGWNELQ